MRKLHGTDFDLMKRRITGSLEVSERRELSHDGSSGINSSDGETFSVRFDSEKLIEETLIFFGEFEIDKFNEIKGEIVVEEGEFEGDKIDITEGKFNRIFGVKNFAS